MNATENRLRDALPVTENRLRDALSGAAATAVDVRPLAVRTRRRSRVPMLLVAAVTVTAVVGAGYAWGGRPDPRTATAVQAPPGPKLEISVFLCKKRDPFPQCEDRSPNRAKIAEALWSRRDVAWIGFEDQAESYENFKEHNKANKELITAIQVKDMPISFRVTPEPGADRKAIVAAVRTLPGVANVIDQGCLSPEGKC
ncbi:MULTISPECIES: permease-like cell division protein FtsX [unclassified Streptosporangium]|uniref:permease-like cell division protein FtsX n=1 Tax=unclassified Streptosporangium TaxID=2632669 RepID=UPI002E2BA98C|nr:MULTISPECIES: permease-like cell division protein FtsX [unclassified Streptosporangium]